MNRIDPLLQLNKDIMKNTRLLIIDHDVCRYHSFDLMMWTLYHLVREDNFDRYSTLRPEYYPMVDSNSTVADRVMCLKTYARSIDPSACFDQEDEVMSISEYDALVGRMLSSGDAWTTPTDLSVRLDPIFERRDMTGFLLRYPNDVNHPIYEDKLTVIEDANVNDTELGAGLIIQNRINAVMLASVDQAIDLTASLAKNGYGEHITFMIGRYGYNYEFEDGRPYYPKHNEILGQFELKYHHEYGYFDPFTGISNQRYEERLYADSEKSGDHPSVSRESDMSEV